jgi:5'-3' exonuclease
VSAVKYYIKYQIKYSLILENLQKLNKKRINFFIDLQSIAKGFYNKDVILVEIGRYATEGKLSEILINELKDFLNGLYKQFKVYDPFFVTFYDDGFCQQQKVIDSSYKSGRTTLNLIIENNEDIELFRQIKKLYYQKIEQMFTKQDLSKVYYLREYEADLIPEYCITNGLFDSDQNDVLNVILSVDKDLLQICRFSNTIQCVTSFKPSEDRNKGGFQIHFDAYNNESAISYINKKFKRGILTAKYIPMILAISGDKADNVPGVRGIGPVKATELIINHNIPPTIVELERVIVNMPDIIKNNFKMIQKNYRIISFEEQLKRIPKQVFMK